MNDYQPLDPKDLERSYFLLTHRPLIKKILLGVAVLVILIIYTVVVLNFIKFIRAGTLNTMSQAANWTYDWASYHQSRQPKGLDNSPAQFFSLGKTKYNLVAVISNPNDDWAVTQLDYTFIVNGQALEKQTAFINLAEKRLLTKMGYEARTNISKLEIKIDNIKWYRVENDLPSVDFEIKEAKFFPATRQTVGEDSFDVPARATWQAKNLSLFNFWEVTWQVALMSGAKIIAVNELSTRDFLSLETRDLEVVWLSDLPRVGSLEIFPVLNKLDFDNFKDLYLEPEPTEMYKL